MTILQNTQEETMKEKENESKRKIQSIENQHQQDMQANINKICKQWKFNKKNFKLLLN